MLMNSYLTIGSSISRIGAIGDDQIFAIDKTIWPRRICRTVDGHGERVLQDIGFGHGSSSVF